MICHTHHCTLIHVVRYGVHILACPVNGCTFIKADKHGIPNRKSMNNGQQKCEIITDMENSHISHCGQAGRLCDIHTGIANIKMVLCDLHIKELIVEHSHWKITKVT